MAILSYDEGTVIIEPSGSHLLIRSLGKPVAMLCFEENCTSKFSVDHVAMSPPTSKPKQLTTSDSSQTASIREAKQDVLRRALKLTGGNRTRAASIMGITTRTLRNMLKREQQERRTGREDIKAIKAIKAIAAAAYSQS